MVVRATHSDGPTGKTAFSIRERKLKRLETLVVVVTRCTAGNRALIDQFTLEVTTHQTCPVVTTRTARIVRRAGGELECAFARQRIVVATVRDTLVIATLEDPRWGQLVAKRQPSELEESDARRFLQLMLHTEFYMTLIHEGRMPVKQRHHQLPRFGTIQNE